MRRIALVGLCNEPLVEAIFAHSRFVAGHQQNGVPAGIEGKSHTPHPTGSVETKFLQVRVFSALESVDVRPAELRAVVREQPRAREQFVLHCPFKRTELAAELVFEKDYPIQLYSLRAMSVNV